MAFIRDYAAKPACEFSAELRQACDDYRYFIRHILKPVRDDLQAKVRQNTVTLHAAFGGNLIAAHSVDYLLAVRNAAGISGDRKDLIVTFDEKFVVAGAYIRNRKMELIDAINNGLKHIRLRPKQYREIIERYGQISARSLNEHDGRIMCHLAQYRFDYCRVVLMPALTALSSWEFHADGDVLDFAKGDLDVAANHTSLDVYDPSDPSTAIDQMIELCASPCANCQEGPDDCDCAEYVFAGEQGQYEPLHAASPGELDALLALISPSYRTS
ncbi:hypothetical protein AB4Z32_25640 [Massilia sp. 2TAF26]|uniref:hypothetical protein n=1 Tax=Massilia sp. 2TAF26 TaxID=3233012 RepID=UPI003F96AC63